MTTPGEDGSNLTQHIVNQDDLRRIDGQSVGTPRVLPMQAVNPRPNQTIEEAIFERSRGAVSAQEIIAQLEEDRPITTHTPFMDGLMTELQDAGRISTNRNIKEREVGRRAGRAILFGLGMGFISGLVAEGKVPTVNPGVSIMILGGTATLAATVGTWVKRGNN